MIARKLSVVDHREIVSLARSYEFSYQCRVSWKEISPAHTLLLLLFMYTVQMAPHGWVMEKRPSNAGMHNNFVVSRTIVEDMPL